MYTEKQYYLQKYAFLVFAIVAGLSLMVSEQQTQTLQPTFTTLNSLLLIFVQSLLKHYYNIEFSQIPNRLKLAIGL